jgi:hypothetical protein
MISFRRASGLAVVLLALHWIAPLSHAQAKNKNDTGNQGKPRRSWCLHCSQNAPFLVDLSRETPSEKTKLRGPRKIQVRINPLRYDYLFDTDISFTNAPSQFTSFISALIPTPAAPANTGTNPKGKDTPTTANPSDSKPRNGSHALNALTAKIKAAPGASAVGDAGRVNDAAKTLVDNLKTATDSIQKQVDNANELVRSLNQLKDDANHAATQGKDAVSALASFLGNSDHVLAISGSAGLDAELKSFLAGTSDGTFAAGLSVQWPAEKDIQKIKDNAQKAATALQNQKDSLNSQFQSLQNSIAPTNTRIDVALASLCGPPRDDGSDNCGQNEIAAFPVITALRENKKFLNQYLVKSAATGAALGLAEKALASIDKDTDALLPGSTAYSAFNKNRTLLFFWKTRIQELVDARARNNPDPYVMSKTADCEFAFSQTKTTILELQAVDRMPVDSSTTGDAKLAGSTPGPAKIKLATVECTSPFSVSAGVAFSTLGAREFGIQQVGTVTLPPNSPGNNTSSPLIQPLNAFVATSKSNFHPLPLLMAHGRLCEYNDVLALHFSFGVAANIQGQNSGGSNPEYLIGPSVSLFRTLFITPGLHIGTVTKLGAGFGEGNTIPPGVNITTPPLQKSYKPGFGLAITFTKP